jgi:hypothetical protein
VSLPRGGDALYQLHHRISEEKQVQGAAALAVVMALVQCS